MEGYLATLRLMTNLGPMLPHNLTNLTKTYSHLNQTNPIPTNPVRNPDHL
jgi:hypothetical protein